MAAMGFSVNAADNASNTFAAVARSVDRLTTQLKALDRQTATVTVQADTSRADRQIAAFGASLAKATKGFGSASAGAAKFGAVALAGTTAITAGLGLVGGAAGAAAGGLFLLAAPIAAATLGADGLKRAFGQLTPQVDALKGAVSAAFAQGMQPAVNSLRAVFPALQAGLVGTAGAMSTVAAQAAAVVASGPGLANLQGIFAGVNSLIAGMAPAVAALAGGFLTFGNAVLAGLQPLAGVLTGFAQQLQHVFTTLAQSGTVQAAMGGLVQVIGALLGFLPPLIGMGLQLMAVIGPPLAQALTTLQGVLAPLGQALMALAPVFGQIANVVAQVLVVAFQALAPIVTGLAPLLGQLVTVIGGALIQVIQMLAPPLTMIAQTLANALAPVLPVIAAAFGSVVSALGPVVAILAGALAQALQLVAPILGQLATILGQALTAALTAITPLMPPLIGAFMGVLGAILPLLPQVAGLAAQLVTGLAPVLPVIATLFMQVIQAVTPLLPPIIQLAQALLPVLVSVVQALMPVVQAVAGAFLQVLNALTPLLPPIVQLVQALLPPLLGVTQALMPIVVALANAFGQVVTALLPLLPPILQLAMTLLPPLAQGLQMAAQIAAAVLVPAINILAGVLTGVITVLVTVIAWVVNFVNTLIQWFTNLRTNITQIWNTLWTGIQAFATTVWNAISGFFATAFAVFQVLFAFVWNAVSAVFTTVWNFIRNTAVTIWTAISAFFTAAFAVFTAFFSTIWNNILAFFTNTWNFLRNVAVTAWNTIYAFFQGAFAAFTNFFRDTWNTIVATFDRIWTGIKDIAFRVWEGVKDVFKGALRWVIDRINDFAGAINKVASILGFNINLHVNYPPGLADGGEAIRRALGGDIVAKQVIRRASGGGVNAANGGRLPHTGTRRDTLPARAGSQPYLLQGREWIIRRDSAQRIGAAGMHAINNADRRPVDVVPRDAARYADGGSLSPIPMATGDQIAAAASSLVPGSRASSTYRPGVRGYHGSNQAADMVGNLMAINQAWARTYGATTNELIYTPGINLLNGRGHTYNAGTRADHYDHVHIAYTGAIGSATGAGVGGSATGVVVSLKRMLVEGLLSPLRNILLPIRDNPREGFGNRFGSGVGVKMIDSLIATAAAQDAAASAMGPAGPGSGPVVDQVRAVANRFGWGAGAQWDALSRLIQKESGWRPTAQNPTSTAYGLFQFLNGTWGTVSGRKTSNPGEQAEYGLRYIRQRYRDPIGALGFHNRNNWYDDGGLARGRGLMMKETIRPERVLDADTTVAFERLVAGLNAGRPQARLAELDVLATAQGVRRGYAPVVVTNEGGLISGGVHIQAAPGETTAQAMSAVTRELRVAKHGGRYRR